MPNGGANVISEYVVRLGAEMDNNGLNQLLGAIDTTKFKAAGLTAVIGALTTGIYKFISAMTQQQFEMEKLARQKDKSIQQTRAEQLALKSMGKTLKEINDDKALKTMYDDLVKFNKELETTNADKAYASVRKLQEAFYKLKSAVNYVLVQIGNQVLTNLEAPMNRIGNKLSSAAEWIKKNLTSVAAKISTYITAFAKGIIGITEAIGKITKWISEMPTGIKAIGSAIGVVIMLLNSGPIGKIIAAITLIGDIIHDYENYQWNKANMEKPEVWFTEEGGATGDINKAAKRMSPNGDMVAVPYQILTGLDTVWDAWDSGNPAGAFGDLGASLGTAIGEGLNTLLDTINQALDEEGTSGTIGSQIIQTIEGIVIGVVNLIGNAVSSIEWTKVADAMGKIVHWIFKIIKDALAALLNSTSGVQLDIEGMVSALLNLISTVLDKAVNLLLGEDDPLTGEHEKGLFDFALDLVGKIISLIAQVTKSFPYEEAGKKVGELLSNIFRKAGDWLKSVNLESVVPDLFNTLKNLAGGILDALVNAFNGLFATYTDENGNQTTGISNFITGIFDFLKNALRNIADYMKDPANDISGSAEEFGYKLGELIGKLIGGYIEIGTSIGENLWKWATSGKALEDFWSIGEEIAKGIVAGFGGVFESLADQVRDLWTTVSALADTYVKYIGFVIKGWLADITNNEAVKAALEALHIDVWDVQHPKTEVIHNGELTTLEKMKEDGATTNDMIEALMNSSDEEIRKFKDALRSEEVTQDSAQDFWNGLSRAEKEGFIKLINARDKGGLDLTKPGIFGINVQDAYNAFRQFFKNGTLENDLAYMPSNIFQSGYAVPGKDVEFWNSMLDLLSPIIQNESGQGGGNSGKGPSNGEPLKVASIPGNHMGGFSSQREKEQKAAEGVSELGDEAGDASTNVETLGKEAKNAWPHISKFGELTGGAETGVQELGGAASAAAGELAKIKAPSLGGKFGGLFGAEGGRYDTDTRITIGEDGPEYLIPISKPERAFALINQMLNEMGSAAIDRVMMGLGLGQAGTIGASMMSIGSSMNGMALSPVYNINAPVNINVQSSGSDAREIGSAVYDIAERHLIRNVMGVYA